MICLLWCIQLGGLDSNLLFIGSHYSSHTTNCSWISTRTISFVLNHLTITFTIFHKQNSQSQTHQCCYRRAHSLPTSLISNLLRVRPGTGFDWHSSCKRQLYCSFHFTASRFETLFSSQMFFFRELFTPFFNKHIIQFCAYHV